MRFSMPDEKEEPSGFKVVDRRSFSVDGSRREVSNEPEHEVHTRPKVPASSPVPASGTVASAPPVASEAEEGPEPGGEGFDMLVSYLSTTALFQLGLLTGPGGERIPPDLPNARRTVDLLEILQQKTRGNLTPDEAQTLDDALYDLRMSFVEVQKAGSKKQK